MCTFITLRPTIQVLYGDSVNKCAENYAKANFLSLGQLKISVLTSDAHFSIRNIDKMLQRWANFFSKGKPEPYLFRPRSEVNIKICTLSVFEG